MAMVHCYINVDSILLEVYVKNKEFCFEISLFITIFAIGFGINHF